METKILIADPSSVDRLIIQNILKGYEVYHAADGDEVLKRLQEDHEIRFLLLDVQISKINAFELLNRISIECSSRRIRTIIMSNSDDIASEIEAYRRGAVDYIRKPANFELIRHRISLHERMQHMQEALENNNQLLESRVVEKAEALQETNRKLHDHLNLFQAIFQQAPVGILVGNIRDYHGSDKSDSPIVNSKFEEITGRSQAELRKVGWKSITHPDDIAKDLELQTKLMHGELTSYKLEKRYVRPDQSIRWVRLIAFPFEAKDKNFNHLIIVEDITKQKQLELLQSSTLGYSH